MVFVRIALAILGYILYKLISSFIATRRFNSFAQQHGCKPPYLLPDSFPYGLRRLRRVLNMKKNGEDLLDDILMEDFKQAATIRMRVFDGNSILHTNEPANLQAMFATQFDDFLIGDRRYNVLKPILGRSIFTTDGAFWQHSRALLRPHFSRDNINDLDMTSKASDKLIEALGPAGAEGWTPGSDALPLLYCFTLDTASDFLFGESLETQQLAIDKRNGLRDRIADESRAKDAESFARAFEAVNDGILARMRLQSLWWLGNSPKFRRAVHTVRDFTTPIVRRAIQSAASPEREDKKESLLRRLAEQFRDENELRNQTLAMLLAGRDTTSAVLCWAILRLALHDAIFAKLRSTILTDFPPGEEITFAKLKGCRYLQHFLNEVLRLHPTVPLNHRVAARDTTLPVGGGPDQQSPIAVRKGQIVAFSVYLLHRRKELWGDDVLDFKPERWGQRYHAWQYLPFGGGPRICLGQQFALSEASFLLVRLLQEFDAIEPVDREEMARMKKGIALTLWPGDGVKVRFRKAA